MLALSTNQLLAEVRQRAHGLEHGIRHLILEMAKRLEILDQVDAVPLAIKPLTDQQIQELKQVLEKDRNLVIFNHADECVEFSKPAQKWIPVTERLPKPSTYVLALTETGYLSVGQNCIVADYVHPSGEENGVFVMAYRYWEDPLKVTHWMPLPEPPKEVPEDA